jgi:hypothetical protein
MIKPNVMEKGMPDYHFVPCLSVGSLFREENNNTQGSIYWTVSKNTFCDYWWMWTIKIRKKLGKKIENV